MNANAIAKNYFCLTPEERFRLILAAGARGDEAERDRLVRAGESLTMTVQDHAPWAHACDELAMTVFMEVLEEAATHGDFFHRWCDADEIWGSEHETEEGPSEDGEDCIEAGDGDVQESRDEPLDEAVASSKEDGEDSIPTRLFDMYLAKGFLLKTKVAGWKMFCERLSIPPFVVWQVLPGFDRLQRALELLEDNEFRPGPAFLPEGMLRWLNRIRPEGAPEATPDRMISPERFADELQEAFRRHVEWWGG